MGQHKTHLLCNRADDPGLYQGAGMESLGIAAMDDKQYRVLFIAEERDDKDLTQVIDYFNQVFRLSPNAAAKLCSGKPVQIKSGVDYNTAMKFRSAIIEAGGVGWIEPIQQEGRYSDRRNGDRRQEIDRRDRSRTYTEHSDRRAKGRRYGE